MKLMGVVLAACILCHAGCFTVSVGDAPEQHAVTIGLVPSTGAAWHAERDIQGRTPLTGGKRFTDALGMTAWSVFTNLAFIGIPTVLNWVTEPFSEWEPPRWGRGLPSRFCKESLIGFCKTRKFARVTTPGLGDPAVAAAGRAGRVR
jgi:hypothetical protein